VLVGTKTFFVETKTRNEIKWNCLHHFL